MTTSTVDTALAQLGQLLLNSAVVQVMPIVSATLTDIENNPATWTNPASAFLKGVGVLGQLQATLPSIESTSVTTLASVVQALIAVGVAKLAPAAPAPTPTTIAAGLTGS